MPRNMSFSMTIPQMRDGSKTVTRRDGWLFVKAGDVLNSVEKCMGLKPGEKIVKMGQIEVVSVRREQLGAVTPEECVLEGFPDLTPGEFIELYRRGRKLPVDYVITRIEFRHVVELGLEHYEQLYEYLRRADHQHVGVIAGSPYEKRHPDLKAWVSGKLKEFEVKS